MRFSYAIPMLLAFVAAEDEPTWVDGAEGTNGKVQWRQEVKDGRWFLWFKATTMHTKADTIAKIPTGVTVKFSMTDQMTLEGQDIEAWDKEEKQEKWRDFGNQVAKDGNDGCYGTLKYKGYKDVDKGTTERSLAITAGGC